MSGTSTNRERAARFRVNRRYFHRTSPVAAWKVRLAVVALLGSLAWTAYGLAVPASLRENVSRGPLARVHGRWDDQCQACHTPYAETTGVGGVLDCRDRWQSFGCDTCHAGPPGDERNYAPHHATAMWPASRGNDCAACHRDHQGADFSLVRVADVDCLHCHRDLKGRHTNPGELKYENRIAGFDDHPPFRLTSSPPARTMKFSHGLHLNPGIVASIALAGNPNAVQALGKLPEKYRKQYEVYAQGPNGLIQLDCAACHQLESAGAPRTAGAYYLPVKFEQHCAACHEQTLSDLKTPAGIGVAGFTVPHGLPREDIERTIRGEVTRQIAGRDNILQKVPVIPPDRLDSPRPKEIAVPSNLKAESDRLVGMFLESLYGAGPKPADGHGCLKCHEPNSAGGLVPTRVSNVWLPSARFDHAAHRAMKCAECHDKVSTNFAGPVLEKEPLAVPGIDTCRQCHGPAGTKNGKPLGGVRYGCVDCHTYHHRTPPVADRGLMVEELLRAKRE
ncbi:MAG TPA: cytochrome c3 family protein [Gemmataceae bacterium]|nr:cytochrome c3 family protein [Gemmataceae bacterium]